MNKKQLLAAWVVGACLLFPHFILAETIYPISSQKKPQSLVKEFNKQKVRMSSWYYDGDMNPNVDKTFEKVTGVIENGEFFIEGANGGFKLFLKRRRTDYAEKYLGITCTSLLAQNY